MVSVCIVFTRAGQASSSPVTAQVFVSLKLYFKFAKTSPTAGLSYDNCFRFCPLVTGPLALGLESELQHMNSYDLMQEFSKHVQQQFLAGLANFYFFLAPGNSSGL